MSRLFEFMLCPLMLLISCMHLEPSADTLEVLGEEKSPNGKFIATSFSCSGGGAAGYFYWNASLRKAGDKLDQRDGLLGKHKTWKGFTDIDVRWIDNGNLEVSCKQENSPAYLENNSFKVKSKHGIKIHYVLKK